MQATMAREAEFSLQGFIWAYRFDADGRGTLTLPERLGGRPSDEQDAGFSWIHLNLTDRRAHDWINRQSFLDETVVELLLGTEPQQSLDVAESGMIYGVLGDFARSFEKQLDEIGFLRFAFNENILITGRRHPLKSAHQLHGQIGKGTEFANTADLFEALANAILDECGLQVRHMGREIDDIEDHVLDDRVRDERRRLGPVRRRAVRLHRLLIGMQGSFKRLAAADEAHIISEPLRNIGDGLAQRADSLHQDVYAMQERARLLQEEIGNKIQDQTNNHLFVLSILTTLFLPPTLISGLFGMNVKGLPFADVETGFMIVLGIAALSAIGVFLLIRRRGMLG